MWRTRGLLLWLSLVDVIKYQQSEMPCIHEYQNMTELLLTNIRTSGEIVTLGIETRKYIH